MAAAPRRVAAAAVGVLRVAAAAVRAARSLSRPLLQVCSRAPVTTAMGSQDHGGEAVGLGV